MKITVKIRIQLVLSLIIAVAFSLSAAQGFADNSKTIGVIMTGDIPYYAKMHKAFMSKLSREGNGNIEVLLQRPYPDPVSWINAARKLIAMDVDIIVSYGAPATLAVMQERSDKPLIYAGIHNPSVLGISGKNITGAISKVPISSLIRYLKGTTTISNLGVLYSEHERDSLKQLSEIEDISKELGFDVTRINIRRSDDTKKIKTSGKLDALFITCSASVNMHLDAILDSARASKLPTASTLRGENNSGIIVTLSASPEEQGELAAEKAIKILRGSQPASIPHSIGKNIELIFNLKENLSLGCKIPMNLVTEATKIIQ